MANFILLRPEDMPRQKTSI